jgi:26S proteasome regulatory subunit N9
MNLDAIPDFLAEQRDDAPADFQHVFLTFEDLWERKLWHELTNNLVEFFRSSESSSQRFAIYTNFILTFADKINQLKLVWLGLQASTQCKGGLSNKQIINGLELTPSVDDQERLKFLSTLAKKVDKAKSQDAYVYAITEVASVKLRLGDSQSARKDLDRAEKLLENFDSVETVVHASFYRVNADYYQAKAEFASYYKNALLYLACVEVTDLTREEQEIRAYNLSIAALVSDTIYNFGELLLHPVLNALRPPHQHSWLRDLLFAFNRGDLASFDRLSNNLNKDPLLESHKMFLYQKISLAALTELVFRRPPHDRAMTFDTISQETKVKPDEIEHLIMKALSLGLLRGKIDQVAEVARINWVQPKVLERSQIEGMRVRLKEWDNNVNELGHWIEGVGKDVWAA